MYFTAQNEYFTWIFAVGGDTTRKILMVAFRKSSCFIPSLLLLITLLLLEKLILGLDNLLLVFRTSLGPDSAGVASAFSAGTHWVLLSVIPEVLSSRSIDFCLETLFFCLSQLLSRLNMSNLICVREFFLERDSLLVCLDEELPSVEPEAWCCTFLRMEPTNFFQSWLLSDACWRCLSMFRLSLAMLVGCMENILFSNSLVEHWYESINEIWAYTSSSCHLH